MRDSHGFPALITAEQFHAAQKRRKEMRPAYKQTPAQKALRRLCVAPPSEQTERIVTDLLTGRMPMTELESELLQSAVSKVRVTSNCVTVTLKNGQVIERRDEP